MTERPAVADVIRMTNEADTDNPTLRDRWLERLEEGWLESLERESALETELTATKEALDHAGQLVQVAESARYAAEREAVEARAEVERLKAALNRAQRRLQGEDHGRTNDVLAILDAALTGAAR